MIIINVCVCVRTCHHVQVEVRGQLCAIGLFFPPLLCGFLVLNSGRQACVASAGELFLLKAEMN